MKVIRSSRMSTTFSTVCHSGLSTVFADACDRVGTSASMKAGWTCSPAAGKASSISSTSGISTGFLHRL